MEITSIHKDEHATCQMDSAECEAIKAYLERQRLKLGNYKTILNEYISTDAGKTKLAILNDEAQVHLLQDIFDSASYGKGITITIKP